VLGIRSFTVGREKMPTWDRLWDDFTQKRYERGLNVENRKINLKMKRTLLWHQRAREEQESYEGISSKQGSKKKFDTSKVKCFAFHHLGIFPANVPTRRRENPRSRWLPQLIWMHLQPDLRMNFHS
jgi:hypothetical protein